MDVIPQAVPLFAGVDAAVNKALGIESYAHLRPFLSRRLPPEQGSAIARAVFEELRDRFAHLASSPHRTPSPENWRMVPQLNPWSEQSQEVDLERRLVGARGALADWWNQVPVASGLINSKADKKRCIDLVHKRGPTAFDFVELKIKSDSPIFAAVEILTYGFTWLLSRHHRDNLGYSKQMPSLLDGHDVRLCVLAPREFYERFELEDFTNGLYSEVQSIAAAMEVTMSFHYVVFDRAALLGDDDSLRRLLDQLFPA